jgi:hypothetical protein
MRVQNILLLLLVSSLSNPSFAGFDEGIKAYDQGNKSLAFQEYRGAAREGDVRAYGKIAGMYLYGAGVERDYLEAYVWFGLASLTGDSNAERFQKAASSAMTLGQVERAEAILKERANELGLSNKME